MKNITSIIAAALISCSLLSCTDDDEIIGYDMTNCGDELVVTSPFVSNTSIYSGSVITFSSELEVDRPWVFTAKAASGATYLEEGFGKKVEIKWDGNTSIYPIFKAGDLVSTELSFICVDDVIVGPTITMNEAKPIPNLLYEIASFESVNAFGQEGEISFGFLDGNTKSLGATIGTLIQDFGAETFSAVSNGSQAEGSGFVRLKGQTLVDDNFFLTGCGVDYEGVGHYPAIDSLLPIKDIFYNIFVRSNGNPNVRLEVQIKEDSNGNLVTEDDLDETFIKTVYPSERDNPGEWMLYSFQLNEFFPNPEQSEQLDYFDKKIDISKIVRFQFNLINETGKVNTDTLSVDIDQALLTLGSPVQY